GLPVAVSSDAQRRFHVAARQFERHLVLKTDDGTAADIYLGKSAGAGRLYARLADDKAIQDISLPLWRVSAKTDDWLDKTTLAADTDQLKQVTLPQVTLQRQGKGWQIKGLDSDRNTDQGKVKALLQRLQALKWDTLVGPKNDVPLADKPTLTLALTTKDGDTAKYQFYKKPAPADNDQNGDKNPQPAWRVTGGRFVYSIANSQVQALQNATPHSLSTAAAQQST